MNNYLIIGNNEYIRKTELDKLKTAHLPSGGAGLNYSVYTSDAIDEIMDAVQTHLRIKELLSLKNLTKLMKSHLNPFLTILKRRWRQRYL